MHLGWADLSGLASLLPTRQLLINRSRAHQRLAASLGRAGDTVGPDILRRADVVCVAQLRNYPGRGDIGL